MKTKKLFATVFAVVLATCCLFTTAAENTHISMPGSETIGVNGSYSGAGTAANVYNVNIEWGEMTFTYETKGDKTWNPDNHTYNIDADDGWKATGNEVTVTNHSNAPVNVAFAFTKDTSSYKGEYTGSMNVESKQLAAGIENKPNEADSVTSELILTGTLNHVENIKTKLGEITVSLNTVTQQP